MNEHTTELIPGLTVGMFSGEVKVDGERYFECHLCGEQIDLLSPKPSLSEAGEFWDEDASKGFLAHAQCGIVSGFPLA
jgi:hypothetical protein